MFSVHRFIILLCKWSLSSLVHDLVLKNNLVLLFLNFIHADVLVRVASRVWKIIVFIKELLLLLYAWASNPIVDTVWTIHYLRTLRYKKELLLWLFADDWYTWRWYRSYFATSLFWLFINRRVVLEHTLNKLRFMITVVLLIIIHTGLLRYRDWLILKQTNIALLVDHYSPAHVDIVLLFNWFCL